MLSKSIAREREQRGRERCRNTVRERQRERSIERGDMEIVVIPQIRLVDHAAMVA